MNTHDVEVAATIHFVWKELSASSGSPPLEADIVQQVLNWKGDRVRLSELQELTRALAVLGVIKIKGDPSFDRENDLITA
jgi:hypothetical protein